MQTLEDLRLIAYLPWVNAPRCHAFQVFEVSAQREEANAFLATARAKSHELEVKIPSSPKAASHALLD
jgi:hypothetical protein